MEIPITQSKQWQKLQDDLNLPNFYQETPDYTYLAIQKSTPVGTYLYLPYGPVIHSKDPEKAALDALASLQSLARKQSAIFIRVEPRDPETIKKWRKQGIKLEKSTDLNPAETWTLDLTGTPDDLKSRLPSRLLRYYRNAAKNGIAIEKSHDPADIHYLLDLQRALAKQKGINTFSEKYLQTELSQPFATLYLVKYDEDLRQQTTAPEADSGKHPSGSVEQIIAAGLVFDDGTTRYNLQGAQSDDGRKLHATGILTIELINDAVQKGLKTFDFWGIAPDDAPDTHPWKGFTAFKKTFAGHEQKFAGTYDLIINPTKYKLYKALRRLRRLA